jgi:hypothetical protein
MGTAAVLVADNKHIDLHCFQVLQRIEQGLTFGGCRSAHVQTQNVG